MQRTHFLKMMHARLHTFCYSVKILKNFMTHFYGKCLLTSYLPRQPKMLQRRQYTSNHQVPTSSCYSFFSMKCNLY